MLAAPAGIITTPAETTGPIGPASVETISSPIARTSRSIACAASFSSPTRRMIPISLSERLAGEVAHAKRVAHALDDRRFRLVEGRRPECIGHHRHVVDRQHDEGVARAVVARHGERALQELEEFAAARQLRRDGGARDLAARQPEHAARQIGRAVLIGEPEAAIVHPDAAHLAIARQAQRIGDFVGNAVAIIDAETVHHGLVAVGDAVDVDERVVGPSGGDRAGVLDGPGFCLTLPPQRSRSLLTSHS